MVTKTDNPAEVGMHVFERAGLGKAPFRFVGSFEKVFQATPDAPRQPGGCCKFCGTGIMIHCVVQDANGKEFCVGSDCINKTGDKGLIRAFKNSPEQRKKAAEARQRARTRVSDEWNAIWANPETDELLKDVTFTWTRWGRTWGEKEVVVETAREHFARIWRMCGAAGERRWLKHVKKLLSERGQQ